MASVLAMCKCKVESVMRKLEAFQELGWSGGFVKYGRKIGTMILAYYQNANGKN